MRILLVNPRHDSIGSRLAGEHLPPLGLLCVAGPLMDAGHDAALLDADCHDWPIEKTVAEIGRRSPDLVMFGHSGSTSAQPVVNALAARVREEFPGIGIVVGGVYPTFHWEEILRECPAIDFIVLGEGEETALKLVSALREGTSPADIPGLAYAVEGVPRQTGPAPLIEDLDRFRVAWELMEGYDYTYWGRRKAVVVQFSRGCPHACVFCGQRVFWRRFRRRDPFRFAEELQALRRGGVEVVNFADESASTDREAWKTLLEEIVRRDLGLILVGSIRADHVVRDADILPLYKKAGFERFLLGIESYDAATLERMRKASDIGTDRLAVRLLREHGILSMATYVVGFGGETIGDYLRNLRQLLRCDPDQIQLIYATPHRWTPFFGEAGDREVITADLRKWDYKHQVLANPRLPPWMVLLCVKLIEVVMQSRPKALRRLFFHRDPGLRKAMRWYTGIGRRVWFWEWKEFFLSKRTRNRITLKDFFKKIP